MSPEGGIPDLSGLRVLVVEDDEDTRELLVELIASAGADVTSAGWAEDALAAFAAQPHDLVLSDIGLPDRDGYALLREIRASGEAGASVPAVALTAFTGREEGARAIAAGFQRRITKPIDEGALFRAVRELLKV